MTATTPSEKYRTFYPSPDLPDGLHDEEVRWRLVWWLHGLLDQLDALAQSPDQPRDLYQFGAEVAESLFTSLHVAYKKQKATTQQLVEPSADYKDLKRISAALRQRADALDPDAS